MMPDDSTPSYRIHVFSNINAMIDPQRVHPSPPLTEDRVCGACGGLGIVQPMMNDSRPVYSQCQKCHGTGVIRTVSDGSGEGG